MQQLRATSKLGRIHLATGERMPSKGEIVHVVGRGRGPGGQVGRVVEVAFARDGVGWRRSVRVRRFYAFAER